jgi:hypothetical protein
MRYPGVTVFEEGSVAAKTWRKMVGIIRYQVRYSQGKIVSFYAYIDYGVTSAWFGD